MCVRLFIIGAWCIICNATGVRVLPCSFDLIHILMYFSYQLKRISSYWAIDYIYLWLLFFFSFHITWLCDVCVCMWMRIYMSVSIYKYYMWVPPVNECVCVNYLPQTKQIYFAMFVFRSQRQVSPINYIAITNKVHFEFVILPILVQTKKHRCIHIPIALCLICLCNCECFVPSGRCIIFICTFWIFE